MSLKSLIISSILLAIGVISVVFISLTGDEQENEVENEEREMNEGNMEIDQAASVNEREDVELPNAIKRSGLGETKEVYELREDYYIAFSQQKNQDYTEKYPADNVSWIYDDGVEFNVENILESNERIGVYQEENNPFVYFGNERVIIMHEEVSRAGERIKGKGHVYRDTGLERLEKIYETQGDLFDVQRKDGELYIYERKLIDNRNATPYEYTPYYVVKIGIESGELTEIGRDRVDPIDDMTDEEIEEIFG